MTKAELVASIKEDMWFLKTGIKTPFPVGYWENKVDDALRKFTVNSGMTRIKAYEAPSSNIQFTAADKVYYVVHVYPFNINSDTGAPFDPFSDAHFFYFFGSSQKPFDIELLTLTKSFLETLHAQYGQGNDFQYDEELSKLYINSKDTYDSLIVEYLPVWSLNNNNSDSIIDQAVIDWIIEYVQLDVKDDLTTILTYGDAFGLPTGAKAFDGAKEEKKKMEEELKSKYPLLGISKA